MKKLSVFGAFLFSELRIRDCVPLLDTRVSSLGVKRPTGREDFAEVVELYFHSPIRLHVLMVSKVPGTTSVSAFP
jgi:hypothetical protein